jgi:2-phosphosulfolactate phosphatase
MDSRVEIGCLPRSGRVPLGWTVVAIDVLRATTTAITAVAAGRRCFPVGSPESAAALSPRLADPILAGELGGVMPAGFHMQNSPLQVERLPPSERPVILLSTTGTRLLTAAAARGTTFAACLRNATATADWLAACEHARVLLLAGEARGGHPAEIREEDRLCCARVAARLVEHGYEPASEFAADILAGWAEAPDEAFLEGRSVEYLRSSGQYHDVEFTLAHVEDLDGVYELSGGELVASPASLRAST